MKRLLTLLCIAAMVLAFMAPGAVAAPPGVAALPEPELLGDKFLDEVGTGAMVSNPEGIQYSAPQAMTMAIQAASAVGDQKIFLLRNTTGGYALTYFTLRGIGTYAEVWVQNNLAFPAEDPRPVPVVTDEQVVYLLGQFDTNIYPTEAEFFGIPEERTGEGALLPAIVPSLGLPADYYVDGTNRTLILVSNIRDANYLDPTYPTYIAGFFSPAFIDYFDRNIISIDAYDWANRVGPNDSLWRPDDGTENDRPYLYEGIFAHEYQHLLHQDFDADEDLWINEGMADYAELLCGYTDLATDGHIGSFLEHPYNSLVAWEDQGPLEILADYGAAYLFQLYLDGQYGAPFIQALAHNTLNGIPSVDDTLAANAIDMSFTTLYRNWVTALLINEAGHDNQYMIPGLERSVLLDGVGENGSKALAWGPAYFPVPDVPTIKDIIINGVSFLPMTWSVVDDPITPGNPVLFAGGGDLANSMLVLPVNLKGQAAPQLTFKTLYDIEALWDFGMVQVSTDKGKTWTSLANEATTSEYDPSAHPDIIANLPGFTGASEGWTTQTFDLSAYGNKQIYIGWRYMTDWATEGNGVLAEPGFYIDDIVVGSKTYDGSTLAPFQGPDQVQKNFARYMISFVGYGTKNGEEYTRVMHVPLQTFNKNTEKELHKFLRDPFVADMVVIVTYAAPAGVTTAIDFSFTVVRKDAAPAGK
ncbi:MAG TPA: choice-of-anchor J domain-containing protein [Symbiobacteriaceae bacterium]|nr:choice-of-anchor J domain-containing protein [Symbiobacteriaceae bacterium]